MYALINLLTRIETRVYKISRFHKFMSVNDLHFYLELQH